MRLAELKLALVKEQTDHQQHFSEAATFAHRLLDAVQKEWTDNATVAWDEAKASDVKDGGQLIQRGVAAPDGSYTIFARFGLLKDADGDFQFEGWHLPIAVRRLPAESAQRWAVGVGNSTFVLREDEDFRKDFVDHFNREIHQKIKAHYSRAPAKE